MLKKTIIPLYRSIFLIIIVLLFISSSLSAENRITFILGKVHIKTKGRKVPAKLNMKVTDNSLIITGRNSYISIYNKKSKRVTTIRANRRLILKKSEKPQLSRSNWYRLFNKKRIRTRPASILAVRGTEEGKEKIGWADDDEERKIDRTEEWKLYSRGKYKKLIKKTKSAKDDEGMFLKAMSTYMLYGASKEKSIIATLSKVENITSNKKIKSESQCMMAIINFEQGKYLNSISYLKKYIQFKKDENIDAISYYMLIISSRYTGKEKDEKRYFRKMKKYHRDSKLLKNLGSL